MSVEISGPQGYDYQYLVSLFFILTLINKNEVEVLIESATGEDAQISYVENNIKKIIDIQVKKRSNQIELDEYCEWISHFEKQSIESNLLTKLNQDKERIVVFSTDARAKDEVSLFINANNLIVSLDVTINNTSLKSMKEKILSTFNSNTNQKIKRKAYCEKFLEDISDSDLKHILRRMILFDRMGYEYVEEKIRSILNREFYVPYGSLDDAIRKLIDVIREGRNSGKNIEADIISELVVFNGNRIFNNDEKYFIREEFKECLESLNNKGVLLLTGVSQCGKTYMAKVIAQEFQNKGYNVKITNDLLGYDGAEIFLNHSSLEDRLCILEDPFGHSKIKEDVLNIVSEIRPLINNLKKNRKLIVTTREDILFKAMIKQDLERCAIYKSKWLNLSINKNYVSQSIWEKYFGQNEKSKCLFNKIEEYLKVYESGEFLQIGQIAHLYYEGKNMDELLELDIRKVIEIARLDSEQLSNKLKERGNTSKYLMIALGLVANTVQSVRVEDLACLLNNSDEKPSLLKNSKGVVGGHIIGERQHIDKAEFPKYKEKYRIDELYKSELRFLYEHRYISIDSVTKNIIFVHPIYHHASKLLLKSELDDLFDTERALNLVYKSLGLLNKSSVLNSIKVMEDIYLSDHNNDLKVIMLKGLYSIFPAVRDRIVEFFDTRIDELSEEEQKLYVHQLWLQEESIDQLILWHNGEPWYNTSADGEYYYNFHMDENVKEENILSIKERLINNEEVSSKEMWRLVTSSSRLSGTKDNELVLKKGLEFDESFIREEATYKLFKFYVHKYDDINKFLNLHEHPNVIYKLFKGALQSWMQYSNDKKVQIVEFIKNSFRNMSVAIRFKKFLENFEDKYKQDAIDWDKYSKEEKVELWSVWYELIIELMIKFPSKYASMNQPHLSRVIESSLEFISDEVKIVKITSAWLDWLDNYSQYASPDDYGMSVTDYLLEGTKNNFRVREDIVERLLNTKKTTFVTSHLKFLIDYWSFLDNSEKEKVKTVLLSDRKDVIWLRAIVINRENVPKDIQNELFGEILMSKDAHEIINKIPSKLLEYGLNIYCGYPQPLWWNGYHHCNKEVWDKIIEVVIQERKDKCFEIALKEFVDSLINYKEEEFKTGYLVWENINRNADQTVRDKIFFRLMHETIGQNQANKEILWSIFLKYCNEVERGKYIKIIVDNIEGIQNFHHSYNKLLEVFNDDFIKKDLLENITEDRTMINFCSRIKKLYEISQGYGLGDEVNKIKSSLIKQLKEQYSINPPRLFITNTYVTNVLKDLSILTDELEKLINDNRIRLIHMASVIDEKFDDHYELDNWID